MKSFHISCRKFLFQWSLIIQNNIVVLFPRYPQKNRILPPRGNFPPVWNHCVREKQENKTKLNVRRCGERKLVDCVQHSARLPKEAQCVWWHSNENNPRAWTYSKLDMWIGHMTVFQTSFIRVLIETMTTAILCFVLFLYKVSAQSNAFIIFGVAHW